jgi:hypothetical protein
MSGAGPSGLPGGFETDDRLREFIRNAIKQTKEAVAEEGSSAVEELETLRGDLKTYAAEIKNDPAAMCELQELVNVAKAEAVEGAAEVGLRAEVSAFIATVGEIGLGGVLGSVAFVAAGAVAIGALDFPEDELLAAYPRPGVPWAPDENMSPVRPAEPNASHQPHEVNSSQE